MEYQATFDGDADSLHLGGNLTAKQKQFGIQEDFLQKYIRSGTFSRR